MMSACRGFIPYHFRNESGKGFIALMSAIIISAVLLVTVVAGGLTGFYGRSNILDGELKSRSSAAADACADQALLMIANDSTYTGTLTTVLNSLDACRAVVSGTSPKSIRIQATSSAAITNLQISYDPSTSSVVSWEELPVF
jgi:hypothetical protein